MSASLRDRFWAKVDRRSPAECWPWRGRINAYGYGVLDTVRNRSVLAHRLSLELALGRSLSDGEVARHTCHIRDCVNPAHLTPGSVADNNRDTREAGREARGALNGQSRLTEQQVLAIRKRYAAGESAVLLGRAFGVSDHTIGLIAHGKRWQHVGGAISPPRRASRRDPSWQPSPRSEAHR